ncbi:MAG: hypothetical protein WDM77_14455 [Steroidobacteraceae bacterium]
MQLLGSRQRPGDPIPALSAEAAQLLLTYAWPGNVRELDNLLQRALILVNGLVIGPEHIQFEPAPDVAVNPPAPVAASAPATIRIHDSSHAEEIRDVAACASRPRRLAPASPSRRMTGPARSPTRWARWSAM